MKLSGCCRALKSCWGPVLQIASLQAERRQLLLDLDVARDAADRLRDNLDNSEQEVPSVHPHLLQIAAWGGKSPHHSAPFLCPITPSSVLLRLAFSSSRISCLSLPFAANALGVDCFKHVCEEAGGSAPPRAQQARRLRGLLDQAGVQHEAELQQAAAEGRRVKLQVAAHPNTCHLSWLRLQPP